MFLIIIIIMLIRLGWLFYFKGSNNVAYQIPLYLELLLIYPFFLIDILGLYWSLQGFIVLYLFILIIQIAMMPLRELQKKEVVFLYDYRISISLYLFSVIVFSIGILSNTGLSIFTSFSLESFFKLANENAISRYSNSLNLGMFYKVGAVCSYFAALVGGYLIGVKSTNAVKLITIAFFSIALLDSLVMASRAGFLMLSLSFISAYYMTKHVLGSGRQFRIRVREIVLFCLAVFSVFGFFVLVQSLRGGKTDSDIIAISSHIITWFVGHLPAFSVWFDNDFLIFDNYSFGVGTFGGVADLLGIKNRTQGVFGVVDIGNGRTTNVFTVFRLLLSDFGVLGTWLLFAIFGVIITNIFKYNAYFKLYFSLSILICQLLMWSFISSVFMYNSILLGALLFILFIMFTVKKIIVNESVNGHI